MDTVDVACYMNVKCPLTTPCGLTLCRVTDEGLRRGETARQSGAGPGLLKEFIIRFLVGGIVVSAFAVLGDLFKPKSFAGLFGAAPSVALATLGLAIAKHGSSYAAVEGRSMLAGAVALCAYCRMVSWLLIRYKWPALVATLLAILLWLGVAFGLWFILLR